MMYEPEQPIPFSLEDVAESCGARAAYALIEHFGGRDVRFPKKPSPDHPIVKALGEEDARAVCHHLSGMKVSIPSQNARRRRVQVARLRAEGKTMGQIARRVGLTQRHVRRIVNRAGDDRQGDLFE